MTVRTQLVDARNFNALAPEIIDKISKASLIGFDIETHDLDAHQGIKDFRGIKTARVF